MVTILISALLGYMLGSFPSGVWLGRMFRGLDVREHGSRSMGATNVFRVLGAKIAILVLVVDIAKGYAACYAASAVNLGDTMLSPTQLAITGGVSAVLGHLFPLFARFRGGKGLATGAGLFLYLMPLEIGFALIVFAAVVILTRYVSLASLTATAFLTGSIIIERYFLRYPIAEEIIVLVILLILLVIFTHRGNIARLFAGTESKFGKKKES